VTASEKKDRNIKALRRLHLLPFTRKQKIIYDLAGLLAYSFVETFPFG
jgi:phenylacetate-coenzyme A ligase PaaK-like adenylate-forming protein